MQIHNYGFKQIVLLSLKHNICRVIRLHKYVKMISFIISM